MSETDKAKLRADQHCPYDDCGKCEIQYCPARTNARYEDLEWAK